MNSPNSASFICLSLNKSMMIVFVSSLSLKNIRSSCKTKKICRISFTSTNKTVIITVGHNVFMNSDSGTLVINCQNRINATCPEVEVNSPHAACMLVFI